MFKTLQKLFALCLVSCILLPAIAWGAEVEFLDGRKLEGKVLSKDDKSLKLEVMQNGSAVTRSYPLSTIHAVTINDKRHVINEKQGTGDDGEPAGAVKRSKAEVQAIIDKVGREPPEWFESTPNNFPKTLDMSWPEKAPGSWDNQKNIGQYIWDVINPNPGKWREGIKLMHHLLVVHKDDPEKRERVMIELGRMYHNLHQDYARAAYWWQKADVPKSGGNSLCVKLAGCYYYLGNKQMAMELLNKQRVSVVGIKLWADMGDMPKAIQMAKQYPVDAVTGADEAYMYIADGFRQAGKPKEALQWYEKVLAIPKPDKPNGRFSRSLDRAQNGIAGIKLFDLSDPKKVADGTYEDQSQGYEAPVRISVTVKGGRIEQLKVVQHREKQFYSALTDTPAKIIAKQGVKGVDATSNATITSNAIINATAKALASGNK